MGVAIVMRVLVIDDDSAFRNMLRQFLERAGYQVTVASNGREGLACFQNQGADLVISDILMPEIEGLETIVALRRMQPALPILAISGGGHLFGNTHPLRAAKKLGARMTLTKPFSREVFMQSVVALLPRDAGESP
jgi:DNA-binding response OmpR family regulator